MKFWKYVSIATAVALPLAFSLSAADPKLVHLSSIPESKVITRTQPVYPPDAIAQGVQGTVRVSIIIGENGHVLDAKAVSGSRLLGPAAAQSVRGWVFEPTTVEDHPVRVVTAVTVTFALDREGRPQAFGSTSLAK